MAASSSRTLLLGYPPPPTTTTTLVPRPTVAELQRWVRSWELPISISALFRMARREAITKRPVRVESSGTVLYQVTVLPTGLRAWKKQGAKVKPRCTQNKRRSQQKQNKEKTKEKETQVGSVRSCVILINRTQSDTSRLTTLQTSVDSKEGQVQPPYPITAFFFRLCWENVLHPLRTRTHPTPKALRCLFTRSVYEGVEIVPCSYLTE